MAIDKDVIIRCVFYIAYSSFIPNLRLKLFSQVVNWVINAREHTVHVGELSIIRVYGSTLCFTICQYFLH